MEEQDAAAALSGEGHDAWVMPEDGNVWLPLAEFSSVFAPRSAWGAARIWILSLCFGVGIGTGVGLYLSFAWSLLFAVLGALLAAVFAVTLRYFVTVTAERTRFRLRVRAQQAQLGRNTQRELAARHEPVHARLREGEQLVAEEKEREEAQERAKREDEQRRVARQSEEERSARDRERQGRDRERIERQKEREALRSRTRQELSSIIARHIQTLSTKRKQLVAPDEYGKMILDGWQREVERFRERVVKDEISAGSRPVLEAMLREAPSMLSDTIERALKDWPGPPQVAGISFRPDMTWEEYERFVERIVRSAGWRSTRTPRGGDQGVDLVVERDAVRIAIQCKRYKDSVPNSAVQEVAAGAKHYDCGHAFVVSNAPFTPAARQLANTNNVDLLHHDELIGRLQAKRQTLGSPHRWPLE